MSGLRRFVGRLSPVGAAQASEGDSPVPVFRNQSFLLDSGPALDSPFASEGLIS